MHITSSTLLLAFFAAVAMAVTPAFHDVIISFPKDAPGHLLDDAKERVRNTKGAKITHEYSIINAFAARVPENMFTEIQALSTEFPAVIEGDGIVTTQDTKQGDKMDI